MAYAQIHDVLTVQPCLMRIHLIHMPGEYFVQPLVFVTAFELKRIVMTSDNQTNASIQTYEQYYFTQPCTHFSCLVNPYLGRN